MGWLKLVYLGVLWTLRVSEEIRHRPWYPCWAGIAPFSERKKVSPRPGIEPGPSTWQAEILTTRLSRTWLCPQCKNHCLAQKMNTLFSQLELSWWERRILCYPAYTGLNCSHIRWPYSGQSEHSTDHHITCTHSGLSMVSYLWLYRGQVSRGKEVSHTLALYTENWK